MKKKILCLALIMIMVLGTSMNVMARDLQGSDEWLVNFDGDKLDSNFTSQSIGDEMSGVQPGDSIDIKVTAKNSYSGDTDWYLANEVVKSLEDATNNASGATYSYKLWYVGSDNSEKVLYDSETVGGDGSTDSGEGLNQVTQLENYLYMGRLSKDQTGVVHLKVALDGETTANDYQSTLASLQLNFAVEKVAEGNTTTRDRIVQTPVKTGDDTRLLLLSVVLLVSGLVVLTLGIVTWKRQRNQSEEE